MSQYIKTPEQWQAIAAKSAATRKANTIKKRQQIEAANLEAIRKAAELKHDIAKLEKRRQELIGNGQASDVVKVMGLAQDLGYKRMYLNDEIVNVSQRWERVSGVYFLVDAGEVVYVGQAVCVHSRIYQHKGKQFDRVAVIPCEPESLDILESLYIHMLRPRLNGDINNYFKCAPMSFQDLIKRASFQSDKNYNG